MLIVAQSTSANAVIGPVLNISGSVMIGLNIDNDAIGLHKNGSVSVARSNTTSAASISPGYYRIPLNATDTGQLGDGILFVSASGALRIHERFQVWQAPTYNLFFGSADGIATSATVAGVSAAVAGVSAAVANVSAAVAAVSGAVAGVSGAVAGVSAAISGRVVQALRDHGLHVLVVGSASTQPTNNSLIGKIMTSASADTYDRTTDSLAAQADVAAAGGVTSAAVSTIISAVVQNVVTLNQIPSSASVSAIVAGAITNADIATSADVSVIIQTAKADLSATIAVVSAAVANVSARVETVRVEQSADQALLSAQIAGVSAAVANVSARVETVRVEQSADQAALSAQIAGVSGAVAAVSAAVANVSAAILTSAETSIIVENAVFQRTLVEASGVPIWSNVQFDDAIEWIFQRNVARIHQASTSVAIYSSANNQIASASVNITSGSANTDRWTT